MSLEACFVYTHVEKWTSLLVQVALPIPCEEKLRNYIHHCPMKQPSGGSHDRADLLLPLLELDGEMQVNYRHLLSFYPQHRKDRGDPCCGKLSRSSWSRTP